METKDRIRARNDYVVNLKAELEIRNLNERIDNLLTDQWQRLLEIQKIQMDIMNELVEKINDKIFIKVAAHSVQNQDLY